MVCEVHRNKSSPLLCAWTPRAKGNGARDAGAQHEPNDIFPKVGFLPLVVALNGRREGLPFVQHPIGSPHLHLPELDTVEALTSKRRVRWCEVGVNRGASTVYDL